MTGIDDASDTRPLSGADPGPVCSVHGPHSLNADLLAPARDVLAVLARFADEPHEMTPESLAKAGVRCGDVSLRLLEQAGLVEHDEEDVYTLSPRLIALAAAAETSMISARVMQPFVEALSAEVRETVAYFRRVGDTATCVAIAHATDTLVERVDVGDSYPLHSGGAPKLLLSAYTPAELEQYFRRAGPGLSTRSRRRLKDDLAVIRETGFAESSGEMETGVWGTAACIRSRGCVIGSVTIASELSSLSERRRKTLRTALRAAVDTLDETLVQRVARVAGEDADTCACDAS